MYSFSCNNSCPCCSIILLIFLYFDSYNFRTKTVERPPQFESNSIYSFQLMLSKFELDGELNPAFSTGPFELAVSSIKVWYYDRF